LAIGRFLVRIYLLMGRARVLARDRLSPSLSNWGRFCRSFGA